MNNMFPFIFPFIIDPAQAGLDAGTTVQVELQAMTRIFSKEGNVLDASAIAAGVKGAALKSTILILDTAAP